MAICCPAQAFTNTNHMYARQPKPTCAVKSKHYPSKSTHDRVPVSVKAESTQVLATSSSSPSPAQNECTISISQANTISCLTFFGKVKSRPDQSSTLYHGRQGSSDHHLCIRRHMPVQPQQRCDMCRWMNRQVLLAAGAQSPRVTAHRR